MRECVRECVSIWRVGEGVCGEGVRGVCGEQVRECVWECVESG